MKLILSILLVSANAIKLHTAYDKGLMTELGGAPSLNDEF